MFKIDSHVKAPKVKKPKRLQVPEAAKRAIEDYGKAYKRVYGVTPELRYEPLTKRVHGSMPAVSVQRLRELTTMLKARVE